MNDMTALLPHIKLRFNIEHPSFEDCYAYGYECALADINEEANPYHLGSNESEQWLEGWWAGFYGEEPLFDLSTLPIEEPSVAIGKAVNDESFFTPKVNLMLLRFLEISGALAVSAIIGYQLIELVA